MWWVQARELLEKEFGQGDRVRDLELYRESEISRASFLSDFYDSERNIIHAMIAN
jgi:hypothetical protein